MMASKLCLPLVVAATCCAPALAQKPPAGYPERPLRFVIPYPPSGGADVIARTVAPPLATLLGKAIAVDNRPGAGGMIGAEIVARAPNDGYTFLLTTPGPLTINASLYSKMPYDPLRDFVPISMLASYSTVLSAHPSLPVRSVKELIALARAKPGKVQYSSGGIGTTQHLSGELLKYMAGVDLVHVPYKGGSPAFADLVAGHVPLSFATPGLAIPYAATGRLRLLAVTSPKRSPALPDVPSISETLPGFDAVAWIGFFAPAGTAADITNHLQREMLKILQAPAARESLAKNSFEVEAMGPEEFARYYRADFEKWAKVISKAGIKAD